MTEAMLISVIIKAGIPLATSLIEAMERALSGKDVSVEELNDLRERIGQIGKLVDYRAPDERGEE